MVNFTSSSLEYQWCLKHVLHGPKSLNAFTSFLKPTHLNCVLTH